MYPRNKNQKKETLELDKEYNRLYQKTKRKFFPTVKVQNLTLKEKIFLFEQVEPLWQEFYNQYQVKKYSSRSKRTQRATTKLVV